MQELADVYPKDHVDRTKEGNKKSSHQQVLLSEGKERETEDSRKKKGFLKSIKYVFDQFELFYS